MILLNSLSLWIWWLKMVDWVDLEKVKKLGLDSAEWFETTKILDNPNISKEEKERVYKEYVKNYKKSIKKNDISFD